jgi:hypothetical protein
VPRGFPTASAAEYLAVTEDAKLSATQIQEAIAVVSVAATQFEPTPRQRLLYHALLASVDLGSGALIILTIAFGTGALKEEHFDFFGPDLNLFTLVTCGTAFLATLFFLVVGIPLLLLNLPLFIKSWRQRLQLQRLGVANLADPLKAVRRRRSWKKRVRALLMALVGVGVVLTFPAGTELAIFAAVVFVAVSPQTEFRNLLALSTVMLSAAWQLGRLRDRLELATDLRTLADELRAFRDREADASELGVSSNLLERTARVEADHIAREREAAIAASASTELEVAVVFDQAALQQRGRLGPVERSDLEDLVDTLTARNRSARGGNGLAAARNGTVEIEYSADPPFGIRITAVREVRAAVKEGSRDA